MKREKKILYRCNTCGEEVNLILPYIVDESQRSETEDMSLFQFRCASCGHVWKLLHPYVYINARKKILVHFLDHQTEEGEDDAVLQEVLEEIVIKGFIKRECYELEQFSEKVRILENELDDRTVELLKIMVFARLHLSDPTISEIYYYRTDENGNHEFITMNQNGSGGITISSVMYQEIEQIVNSEMPTLLDRFYRIDPEWAGRQITDFQHKDE